jgi:predicted metal-binding protein
MREEQANPSWDRRTIDCDNYLEKYCAMGIERGATHAKQISPVSVVTAPWVRLKCQFGSPSYGMGHCCPPGTPDLQGPPSPQNPPQ